MPTWREYRIIDPLDRGGGPLWESARDEGFSGMDDVRWQFDYWRKALNRETASGQPQVLMREVTSTNWERIRLGAGR